MKTLGCPSPSQALRIAETVLRTHYPDAVCAFVAGSIMRGQGTHLSDIDLVVLYEHLHAARRESFIAQDVPIEAFVHDPHTLAWFIDADVRRGRPSLLNMISEGTVIGAVTGHAEQIRQHVTARLQEGPAPLSSGVLNALRYEITDALDDLCGERSASEQLAIGAMLHGKLVELTLRGRGLWYGTGKWAPRLLIDMDEKLAERFDQAFRRLFGSGDATEVIRLVEDVLAAHGGRLFEGDCRVAPVAWRV